MPIRELSLGGNSCWRWRWWLEGEEKARSWWGRVWWVGGFRVSSVRGARRRERREAGREEEMKREMRMRMKREMEMEMEMKREEGE
jgi:hypothetical protein